MNLHLTPPSHLLGSGESVPMSVHPAEGMRSEEGWAVSDLGRFGMSVSERAEYVLKNSLTNYRASV